ncbi:MAG: hypothetical protein AAFW98_17030 [Pseudomonadota bacterium]
MGAIELFPVGGAPASGSTRYANAAGKAALKRKARTAIGAKTGRVNDVIIADDEHYRRISDRATRRASAPQ